MEAQSIQTYDGQEHPKISKMVQSNHNETKTKLNVQGNFTHPINCKGKTIFIYYPLLSHP